MVMLAAIIHKEEDMYVAECPEIGTVTQGKTIEDCSLWQSKLQKVAFGAITPNRSAVGVTGPRPGLWAELKPVTGVSDGPTNRTVH